MLSNDVPWAWTDNEARAFEIVKRAIGSVGVLVHYDPTRPLTVNCDASQYGIGAVLAHKSRSLSSAEKNYSQLDKEAMAMVFGVCMFHQYLYGRDFEIYTDHKPLVHMFGAEKGVNPMSSARMQRWYLTLSSYDYRLYYKPGKENVNADALSKLPLPETLENTPQPTEIIHMMEKIEKSPINARAINQWTARDPVLSKVLDYTIQGWPKKKIKDEQLHPYAQRSMEISAQVGCLLWGSRIVVPPQGRVQILGELHTSHPGISRMKAFARSYVWWPNMDTDIERLVRSCHQCQVN